MPTDDTITLSGTPTLAGDGARANTVIPRRLGHVSLIRELGQGGMGTVWLGRDEMLGREVAVKFLLNAVTDADDPGFARFLEGARAAATLRHPGLTAIHAAELINGVPYQVMEFVNGPTVAAVLERLGGLAPSVAHAIIDAVADAIGVLHERGIVHHDIKPSNVLLDAEGRVFVTDFGLTCRRATTDSKVQVSGTPAYMAPEIFDGQVSPKSDVYALGVMLYEMLTGERPFRSNLANTTQRAEREAMPREPLAKRRVSDALIEVIERAVNVNPLFRHKSAATFRHAVDEAMGARPDAIRDARAIAALVSRVEGQTEAAPTAAKTPGESTPTYFDSLAQIAAKKRGAPSIAPSDGMAPQGPSEQPVAPTHDPYPTGRLPDDRCIPCVKCGYDVRGQRIIGRCPECGLAIEESANPERLVFCSMAWLRKVTLGLKLIRHTLTFAVLLIVIPIGVYFVGFSLPGTLKWLVMNLLFACMTISPVVGVWMATTPEPGISLDKRDAFRAWVARLAAFVFGVTAWMHSNIGRPETLANAVLQSIVLGMVYFAGMACFGVPISRIVARIPDVERSRWLRVSSIAVGILLSAMPAMALLRPWLGQGASGVLFFLSLAVLWYFSRLSLLERAFRKIITMARRDT